MNKQAIVSMHAEHPLEKAALRALLSFAVIFTLLYGYFVALSVFNVIARKEALAESVRLSSLVADLDRQHFELSEGLTPERGRTLGLVSAPSATFVYRPGAVGTAVTRNEI